MALVTYRGDITVLKQLATARGVTMAQLVTEAINKVYGEELEAAQEQQAILLARIDARAHQDTNIQARKQLDRNGSAA